MRVNGVEKLTCITAIRDVTQNGGVIRVDPLRNFTLVSDLAVDMGLYIRMDKKVFFFRKTLERGMSLLCS